MAKKRIQNLLKHVVCILLCLCVVLPFYMVLINSFKTKAEAARMSLALPTEWVFSNYSEVIEKGSLIQMCIRDSLFHQRESLCTCLGCADYLKIRICFFNLMYQIIQKKFFIFCHNNSIVHSIIPPHLSENTVQ